MFGKAKEDMEAEKKLKLLIKNGICLYDLLNDLQGMYWKELCKLRPPRQGTKYLKWIYRALREL